jgi:NADH-quinone oxidoreductase subunit H
MLLDFLFTVLKAVFVIFMALQIVPLLIYLERKLSAYIQGRIGPNRVNFTIGHVRYLLPKSMHGMIPESLGRFKLIPGSLQPMADAIKLIFKEEVVPKNADKLLWLLGPPMAFMPVAAALAFLPFGSGFEFGPFEFMGLEFDKHVVDMRVTEAPLGMLAMLAVASLSIYGILCGGWGSGSKFPLIGAVRAAAQMISYEVALGLGLLAAIVTAGSVDGQEIVLAQTHGFFTTLSNEMLGGPALGFFDWIVFKQPLAALICLVAIFAENNRLPFDLPEAEPELVGGYHTEYSGLKFAVYFLGEYCAMILMSGLFVTLFLGGWSLPGIVDPQGTGLINCLLSVAVFGTKLMAVLIFQVWIRWTLPRFRYDQLMNLGWKTLVPLTLVNLVVTAVVLTYV